MRALYSLLVRMGCCRSLAWQEVVHIHDAYAVCLEVACHSLIVIGSSSWCCCQSGTRSCLSGLAPELSTSLKASRTQSHISWLAKSALFVTNNAGLGRTGCLTVLDRLLNIFFMTALLSHLLLLFKLAEVLRYHKWIR